ncbi:hypothetical protein H9Q13_10695 [Pontibacter sp. JH31]|uniref:Uncharacterized protein n=1 Tax=Pontibacter aquaedesilientis TaxID=2766980 RepID=A0ABR7XI44_9BACT|nr:hypothetical protein [Pontibacter aquaedesilientis]MBD1397636.1 hypothetical protein [Pontibacter aquaedesilientis]
MIKKVELLLNAIHYCWYKADYKRHLLTNKLNPFMLLGEIPAVKRKFEQQGTSHKEVVNGLWCDERFGFSIKVSGGGLTIIMFMLIWAVFLMLNSLLTHPIGFSWKPFLVCLGLAFTICHLAVFQKDRYMSYFRQFEKWTSQQKLKFGLLALSFTVGGIALFIYSFRFLYF